LTSWPFPCTILDEYHIIIQSEGVQMFGTSNPKPSVPSAAPVRTSARTRLLILALLLAAGLTGYASCLTYIGPDELGIKQVMIGLDRGIHKKPYQTGYRFVLPEPFERMHKFPKSIQVLELSNNPITRSQFARHERAAYIQTSDGFFVEVDASVLYRIVDPYQVFVTLGPGRLFEDNGIVPRAEAILKQTLGELTTEEFYNSPLRVEKVHQAREIMNQELRPKGLEVEHVLVRYFQYSEEIQKNIEEKKLKDQLVFKNQAEARASAEMAKLKKTIEEGRAAVGVKLQEGQAYAVRRKAEADMYSRARKAEADLLVSLAEAERTALKNQALQGPGSDILVGLQMAEVYRGLQVLILPSDGQGGLNPLDLEQTLRNFELRGR
jgi:regulator of protease activity HflC (stomatin/prohibitin superfamily)